MHQRVGAGRGQDEKQRQGVKQSREKWRDRRPTNVSEEATHQSKSHSKRRLEGLLKWGEQNPGGTKQSKSSGDQAPYSGSGGTANVASQQSDGTRYRKGVSGTPDSKNISERESRNGRRWCGSGLKTPVHELVSRGSDAQWNVKSSNKCR